jgi:hypothetical protein
MYYYYNQDTNTSTKLCTVNSLLFMICQFSWIILKHEIIRIQRIFNTVYTCTEYSMGSYQLSWISWIVTNHEIKNSTIFWHHIHITEYSMGWYQLSWISWIVSHNEIKNSTNICPHTYVLTVTVNPRIYVYTKMQFFLKPRKFESTILNEFTLSV